MISPWPARRSHQNGFGLARRSQAQLLGHEADRDRHEAIDQVQAGEVPAVEKERGADDRVEHHQDLAGAQAPPERLRVAPDQPRDRPDDGGDHVEDDRQRAELRVDRAHE
jgi:hypothetical protein